MSLSKVIEVAKSQIGKSESPPNSNNILYNTEYYGHAVSGPWYAWCVVFLWWVFTKAGEAMAFFNGGKTASCTTLMNLYKEEGKWYDNGDYIPGDIAILNFNKTKDPQHCGLIIDYADDTHKSFITVEGNTTPGTVGEQDNGGCVSFKVRPLDYIIGACRPTYKEDPPPKDWETHWAKDYISDLIEKNIVDGYEDRSFKPDQHITRAEAAVMVDKSINYILKNGMGTLESKS